MKFKTKHSSQDASPIGSLDKASALRNGGFWKLSSTVVRPLQAMVVSVIAARMLGPETFGELAIITFTALTVADLAALCVPEAIMRFGSIYVGGGKFSSLRYLYRWGTVVMLISGILGFLVVATVGLFSSNTGAWVIAAVSVAVIELFQSANFILIAMQRWRDALMVSVITKILTIPIAVIGLLAGLGISAILIAELAAVIVNCIVINLLCMRSVNMLTSEITPIPNVGRKIAQFSFFVWIALLFEIVVVRRSGLYFLEVFGSKKEVGIFAIAFSLYFGIRQFPLIIHSVMSSVLSQMVGADDTERMSRTASQLIRVSLILLIPISGAAILLGPSFITVMYGENYKLAGTAFAILLCGLAPSAVFATAQSVLVAVNRMRTSTVGFGIASIVNVVIAIGLIPVAGIYGAAIASVLGQVTLTVLILRFASEEIGAIDWKALYLARMTGVVCVSLAVGYFIGGEASKYIALALEASMYLLMFVLLSAIVGVIDRDDAAWLSSFGENSNSKLINGVVSTLVGFRQRQAFREALAEARS